MKITSLALAGIPLLELVVTQPHRRRHLHQEKHVENGEDVVVTVIDTVYAQVTEIPEAIVFVNQFGKPLSTMTEAMLEAPPSVWTASAITLLSPSSSAAASKSPSSSITPAAAPAADAAQVVSSSSSTPVAYTVAVPASSSPSAVTSSATRAQTSTPSSSSPPESTGFGFSYSPYNADGSCKTQDQVNTDFDSIGNGYSLVRTYGTDCNQVATVLSAARSKGLKMFAGIYYLSTLSSEIETIVTAASGDWTSFDTISIGNELVNSGTASAATVVAAISTARGLLTTAGYTGKVVTVDTLVAARANPSLCDASDYCAVNCHPFFDGNTVAADSGSFLTTQIPTLQAVLSNKNQEVVITETGWPWQGDTNGVAVPSPANQAAALSSIKGAFSSNQAAVILFTTFNDLWKTNTAAQFNAEQYWGFLGNSPSG